MSSSNVAIVPYKLESQSAINLQDALHQALKSKVRRLYNDERGSFVGKARHTVINWGASAVKASILSAGKVINHPDKVKIASDKLTTFQALSPSLIGTESPVVEVSSVSVPLWTTDRSLAETWISEGKVVVCRTKLNGHSGAGIKVAARVEDLVDAPLYTQYIKKAKEFRVHVAFGNVIDVQAKRKRIDFSGEVNYAVRNHDNGWVYCRENIEEPEGLRVQAVSAVAALGLDFGAVDIIYNQHYNKCYVLEVNTAPGLEGTSVTKYKEAFLNYLNGVSNVG